MCVWERVRQRERERERERWPSCVNVLVFCFEHLNVFLRLVNLKENNAKTYSVTKWNGFKIAAITKGTW